MQIGLIQLSDGLRADRIGLAAGIQVSENPDNFKIFFFRQMFTVIDLGFHGLREIIFAAALAGINQCFHSPVPFCLTQNIASKHSKSKHYSW